MSKASYFDDIMMSLDLTYMICPHGKICIYAEPNNLLLGGTISLNALSYWVDEETEITTGVSERMHMTK